MNNEQQQIIDEAYENYHQENKHVMYLTFLLEEEFIRRIKHDTKFSEKWGLEIEERELTFEERWDLSKKYGYRTGDVEMPSPDSIYLGVNERQELESLWNDPVVGTNLPTKLVTITYKDKTIESYEYTRYSIPKSP